MPDWDTLTAGLRSALGDRDIEVLSRHPNPRPGKRAATEIVVVNTRGLHLQLFCKYSGESWHSHGLWGVEYETTVYRQILARMNVGTPRLIGTHDESESGRKWLILEHLEDCTQLKDAPQPIGIVEAARWLGRFHALTEVLLGEEASLSSSLKRFDDTFYNEWSTRLVGYTTALGYGVPWLKPLCDTWVEMAAETLAAAPTSIVHGDMYGTNVMHCPIRGPVVIDWESAAVGAGEVDLAFLTEGWPAQTVRLCEEEYRAVRWPGIQSTDFMPRLRASRIFHSIRWLGDHPEWISADGLEHLRTQAVTHGLI